MLLNTIFTFLWAAALATAFPSLSLSKWQSSRRSVEVAQVEARTTQTQSSPAIVPGGVCGWVAVEVPVEQPTEQHSAQNNGNNQQPDQHVEQESTGQKGHESSAPSQTLAPSVHWTWDTSALKNVEPVAPKEDSPMYYGVSDPTKQGYFAFLTYRFTLPSVNLDHSSHVQVKYTEDSNMVVQFKTLDAFERATESWEADADLLLIATADGCTGPSAEDRCYFRATSWTVDKEARVVVATGATEHPENMMDSAETEWGLWTPHNTPGGNSTSPGGNSFNLHTNSSGKAPSGASHDSHGLAVASFGPSFDSALDDASGYHQLRPGPEAFLNRIIADGEAMEAGQNSTTSKCVEPASPALRRRRVLQARGFWSNLWHGFVDAIKTAYNTVADALSIQGDFNEPVSWDLPGPDIPREVSPWSANSIALFKHESVSDTGDFAEHVHIYCVDCGVSGQAVFSGKAKITPLKGIFDGEVALRTNMKMVLKVGVDASIRYSKNIQQDLFSFGLPGLSYGIVTVGPYISVAARVGLEAAAKGRLLVGGEMGLTQAEAVLYLFEPSRSTSAGWTPYFKPVLEAEGEIMLAASAALPIGIKVGLKISSFEAALGIMEEPTISAVAQVAGSAHYDEVNGFQGGFKEVDGCAGISTSLSWRNKLSLDIVGITSQVLHDTGLQPIVKGCLNLKKGTAPKANAAAIMQVVQNSSVAVEPHHANTTLPSSLNLSSTVNSLSSSTISLPSSPTVSSTTTSLITSTMSLPSISASSLPDNSTVSLLRNSTITSVIRSTTTGLPSSLPTSSSISSPNTSALNLISAIVPAIKLPVKSQSAVPDTSSSSPVPSPTSSPTSTPSSVESNHPQSNSSCAGVDETAPQVFKDGHRFDLAPLLTTTGTSMVASCNDGNIYVAAASNQTSKTCNGMWPTSKEAIIPFDGNLNVMHYYAGAMKAVGVSRLRSSPAYKMPNDAVVAILVPAPAADGSFFYMAADASQQIFYPVVCEFAGAAVPRVFLAKELSAGIRMLEGGSVAESITGAKAEKCFGLSLSPQF
ncbi:hypothetical protein CCM_07870 [Cordyceps militaris CM01]|uniref:DUF7029 domain-containing protein n=1 Tax=Cordyceps militaris (strain CM01) TaxID=983644 RepID=G3JP08_CORMM|nr:uncharacterized protein CCM_07870 [Cordyceps militaris CM01]EGX89618.1 hypothetical protein CCM_07870 [Cordyceps militaris CM01]